MAALKEVPIKPPPGVVLTQTEKVAAGRWIASMNMRFVAGLPQKIGGNILAAVTPTSGTPRGALCWRDNLQNNYFAVGTYRKLYVYDSSWLQNDITPFRATGTLGTNPLAVQIGSNVVTVAQTLHGANIGDTIIIAGSTAIGGITPNGTFTVSSVPDANHYMYVFSSNATSTVAAGGGSAITYEYEVPIGTELGAYGLGWGVGGWGTGTWGTARAISTIIIEPRVWSNDHFGQILVSSYNGGSIYTFDPTQPQPWPRAVLMSSDPGLPTNCRFALVTNEEFVFAGVIGMQIYWCSQGNFAVWTPAINNTANIRTLQEGTKLVGGRVLADFVVLIWSDAAVFLFQYTGSSAIYNSSMIAKDCGLLSPQGAVTAGGVGYWIGQDTFWNYNGTVLPMANVEDIRSWFFGSTASPNLDPSMVYQACAIFVADHNEVWFFATQLGQTNPNFGAIYSIENQCWAPLYFGRTTGSHFTQGGTTPYMGNSDFFIYQHETGNDNNGVAMPWSLTLARYALTPGGSAHMDIERFEPDFFGQIGNVTITISTWDRLTDTVPEDSETDTIVPTGGGLTDMRVSGRYASLMLNCSSLGSYVRLGVPVAFIRPSGVRL